MSNAELFKVRATMVADDFIDKYMPDASGDYVKVYLYLLKNDGEGVDVARAAEALRLTEGDITRAVRYWIDKGVMVDTAGEKRLRARYMSADGRVILEDLAGDTEFTQLLVIIQKYMSRILSERDQEVFAYLYDGLGLPADVLEYLVEYAVQTGHASVRYIEKTGLDWASLGIRDVASAKERTDQFDEARRQAQSKKKKKSAAGELSRDFDPDDWMKVKLREQLS